MSWMTNTRTLMAVVAVVLLCGCQPPNDLEPADESGIAALDEQVEQTMNGVQVTVDGDAWTGDPDVPDLVTPVKVTIDNNSGKDLRIRFPDFALLGAYDRYSVLPLFQFDATGDEVMLVEGYAPVTEPAFGYETFYVTDYYSQAFPDFASYPHALVIDDDYYARYTAELQELPLPLVEMQRWALPEGVLPSGSSLVGFLFFEGLHPGEEKVIFLAQLEEASTGDYFGAIQVPLKPEGRLEP